MQSSVTLATEAGVPTLPGMNGGGQAPLATNDAVGSQSLGSQSNASGGRSRKRDKLRGAAKGVGGLGSKGLHAGFGLMKAFKGE